MEPDPNELLEPEKVGVADFKRFSEIPPLLKGSGLPGRYALSSLSQELSPMRNSIVNN